MQAKADFATGFQDFDEKRKVKVAGSKRQKNNEAPATRGLGFVGRDDQLNELCVFVQSFHKENAMLPAACTTETADYAKNLMELKAFNYVKDASKKGIKELTQRLAKELLDLKRSVADKRHTESAVTAINKLTEQVKQLSVCVAELKSEKVKGKNASANLKVKLKEVK